MSARPTGDHHALLEFAVTHSPAVFFTSDPDDDFRITFITDNIERLSGHSPSAIVADGGFTRRHIHPDDLIELERALESVSARGYSECEYRIRDATGHYVWFREEVRLIEDDGGRRVVGNMIDVTDRKEAERERHRLHELLRDAIDSMPNAFVLYDPDHRLVLCNTAAAQFLGTSPEDLVGRHATEMIDSTIRATRTIDGRIVDDPEAEAAELYARQRAANRNDVEVELTDGRSLMICVQPTTEGGTVVTRTDITETKSVERGYAHNLEQLRTVLDNTPSSIVKIDRGGRYVYVNPAYCQRIGEPREKIVGRTIAEAVGQDNADLVESYFQRALAGEKVRWQGWANYAARGKRYVQRDYQPDYDAQGNIVGMIAFTHDLTDLKEAQSSLEEREARFRAIAEAVPTSLLIVDNSTRKVVFANRLARERLGTTLDMSADDLEGRFVDPVARQTFLAQLARDGQVSGLEAELHQTQGETRWVLISSRVVRYGGASATLTSAADITDHKRAEQALRESEARFRDFADSASDWFWETDENFRLRWFSTEVHPISGEPTSNNIGGSLMNSPSYHVGDAGLDSLIATIKAKRPFKNLHVRRDAPDGTTKDLHLSAVPFFDDGGNFRGYRGSTSDVTDQKRAEQALRASEAQTRAILDNIPARVVLSDKDRRLIYVNRRYREDRHSSDDEWRGRTTAEVLGIENAEMLQPLSDRALAGESGEWQGWIRDPVNGDEYQQRIYQPFLAANGEVEGYLTYVRDLTDQKRTEEELEKQRELFHQNEKLAALGSLLAGVAHELNNPLSVVVGRSIMLADEVDDPGIANAVGRIRDAAERCARIVKTFLAMARQQAPSRSPVAFNEMVRASLDIVEYNLRTTDVRIDLQLAPDLPLISADPNQLSQVLVNLSINAGQAMEKSAERRLTITTGFDEANERITVDFADTGCGIAPGNLTRIFDPFFTTKPHGIGTGVGLSISHGIVTAHDGTIEVDSQLGKGTTFHLTFPTVTEQDPAVAPGRTPTTATTATILVVDDEPEIAEMLFELLSGRGHRVEVAHSGREALGLIARADFDLIVSDLKMPDVGGRELYRLIGKDKPDLRDRFVFMTGDTLGADMTDFIRETGLVCLEKPLTPSELIEAIETALEPDNPVQP